MKNCPTCLRPFTDVRDYPVTTVTKIEFPDHGIVLDTCTWASGGYRLDAEALQIGETAWNEISGNTALQEYLSGLKGISEQVPQKLKPEDLLPHWPKDSYYQHAYPIPGNFESTDSAKRYGWNKYYICESTDEGISKVALWTKGPNMGSAGGPSIQQVGVVATIHFQGNIA